MSTNDQPDNELPILHRQTTAVTPLADDTEAQVEDALEQRRSSFLARLFPDELDREVHAHELAQLRMVLRFLEGRDHPLDPGLFRVKVPKPKATPLPRFLPEADYRWLETNVLQATKGDTYNAYFDRAWFLTLAHTGVRISELLDLRLDDLNLEKQDYELAAEYFNTARKKGIQGSNTDFLICAISTRHNMPILTTDKDFSNFQKVFPVKLHNPRV